MWISRRQYDALLSERQDLHIALAEERGRVKELTARVTAQDTTVDWFRVRVNQLEHERAQLLYNYTGVKVETPVIQKAPEAVSVADALHSVPNFNDIGDAEARKLGIGWNDDGTIKIPESR